MNAIIHCNVGAYSFAHNGARVVLSHGTHELEPGVFASVPDKHLGPTLTVVRVPQLEQPAVDEGASFDVGGGVFVDALDEFAELD